MLLPHLRERAVSFLRYPDSPDGQVFFTKNVPPGTPDWVTTAEVPRSEGPARMVLVQDLASLMWAANLVTEFHHPPVDRGQPRRGRPAGVRPEPGPPATVVQCCEVALWLRERLAADGIEAYANTSGAKGLHLLAGVRGSPSERVSDYAKALAAVEAERALPKLVVHRMTRSLRPGKVFVDWSQNAARKTTAAPYTVRARDVPAVSTPVTWEEVAGCGRAEQFVFLAPDVGPRVQDHGDLLAPLFDRRRAATLP
ncbi:non-homologous end-joining DNA ligase [Streptomyces violaceorubidus]